MKQISFLIAVWFWLVVPSMAQLGLNTGLVAATTGDPASQAYVAQRPSLSSAERVALSIFVIGLKSDGVWPKINDAIPLMGGSFADVFVKLKGSGTPTGSNFVAGDYLGSGGCAGLRGNGTDKAVDTNFQADTLTEDDTHFGILFRSNYRTNSGHGVLNTEAAKIAVYPFGDGNYYSDQYNSGDGRAQSAVSAHSYGFMVATRTGATVHKIYQDAALLTTDTSGGGTLPAVDIHLFNINGDSLFSQDIIGFYSAGAGLSATDVTNYTARLLNLESRLTINGWGAYLMPTFSNTVSSTGTLAMLTSNDGVQWGERRAISFTPDSPDATSGDYSIFRHTDGFYYLTYTRTRSIAQALTSCGLSRSADGLTWVNLTNVDFSSISGCARVWAPEWFVDPADNSVNLLASVSTTDEAGPFQTYIITLSGASLASRTAPDLLAGMTVGSGNFLDPFVVKVGSQYFQWVKDESSKYLVVFVANSLRGTYSAHRVDDWMGIGAIKEGPSVLQVSGVWRAYFDRYSGAGFGYAEQTAGDWTSGGSTSWSAVQEPKLPFVSRHGTVYRP